MLCAEKWKQDSKGSRRLLPGMHLNKPVVPSKIFSYHAVVVHCGVVAFFLFAWL